MLAGANLRHPQSTHLIVFHSLKQSFKIMNMASKGKEVNIRKYTSEKSTEYSDELVLIS